MIRKVCTCDICSKEMVIKGQYASGYEFKRYLLTNCDVKNKMDICTDCFQKFKTYVKEQLKEQKK